MAEARKSQRLRRASRGRGEAEEDSGRQADDDAQGEDNAQQEEGGNALSGDSDGGVFSTLKDTATDAALAVLKPVAKKGATKAAQFAVEKGPELFEDKVMPMLEEAGGPMGLVAKVAEGDSPVGGLLSKLTGGDDDEGGDRDAGDGTGQGRRMPIQQAVDVAAPIDIVYDQFTQFEDWPKFMHRLESASQKDDATVEFNEKIWIIRRRWEAEIVEQRPDERIVWESTSGMQHVGVVTFHELAERLTRIEVNVDIDPSGPMEKIARGARFAKRAVRADLHRFKAYVEMHEDETGAWRGEIQDGEVVTEDGEYDEQYEDEEEGEEPEAESDDEPEAEAEEEEPEAEEESDEPEAEAEEEEPEAEYEDEEPEASEDEEDEDAQAEDEDEEEQPRTRTRRRSSTRSSSNGSSKSESAQPKRGRSKASSSGGGSSSSSRGGSKSGSGSKSSKSKSSSGGSRSRGGSSSAKSKSSSSGSGSSSRSRSRGSSSKSGGSSSKSTGRSSSGGKSRAKASSSKS